MNKLLAFPVFILLSTVARTQNLNSIITEDNVRKIETVLSADDMNGRKAFTPSADKAADFISNEFKAIGLLPLYGLKDYKQSFSMVSPRLAKIAAVVDGKLIEPAQVIPFTTSRELVVTERSGFTKAFIKAGSQFRKEIYQFLSFKENVIVFVDPSFASTFSRLTSLCRHIFKTDKSVVFVLGHFPANTFRININQKVTDERGANVIGVLPGKGKKAEMVIFSAHYDHIGTDGKAGNDTIYNGANDDASGVTAIIEIAKYYKAADNNDRTLVFACFTAEESGGFGSQYFSKHLDADKVVAMFNIEMIGTESRWGRNSAYITGYEKSNLGMILQKNLQNTDFTFYPDPYTEENLFYRSDNATLARLGVPAHTISTSKMDNEPNYHKVSDEVNTVDIANMTRIIKSIIISAASIVKGHDMPSRLKANELARAPHP